MKMKLLVNIQIDQSSDQRGNSLKQIVIEIFREGRKNKERDCGGTLFHGQALKPYFRFRMLGVSLIMTKRSVKDEWQSGTLVKMGQPGSCLCEPEKRGSLKSAFRPAKNTLQLAGIEPVSFTPLFSIVSEKQFYSFVFYHRSILPFPFLPLFVPLDTFSHELSDRILSLTFLSERSSTIHFAVVVVVLNNECHKRN